VSISLEQGLDAKKIETAYTPIRYTNGCTELEVHLITGKTHQIRAHLSAEGHPIVGDPKYGDVRINAIFRRKYGITHQMLHAYRLEFEDGRIVTAPCGEEFDRILS
jgi:23S rRNA pseudouridine955/2504/2580 synthase